MTAEEIRLDVESPPMVAIPRVIEVACGESYVTVKQMDGRTGRRWTVYSNDGAGMSGPVHEAPTGTDAEQVLPWAKERARLLERERLSFAALRHHLGEAMPTKDAT